MDKRRATLVAGVFALIAVVVALGAFWITPSPQPSVASAPGTPAVPAQAASTVQIPAGSAATYEVVAADSQALYRVREQLAGVSFPNDAVGTTRNVSGRVVFGPNGEILAGDSRITVNLASLRSDQSMRDNFVTRNILGTQQYPNATFVPTAVNGLPFPLPASGTYDLTIAGNLTIRNVTRPVEWTGTAELRPDGMLVKAQSSFKFEDFSLAKPRVARVLSVADEIRVEADLTFRLVAASDRSTSA